MSSSSGNDRFYPLGDAASNLGPEEKFLWWLIHRTAESLRVGLESKKKNEIVEALECLDWFFRKNKFAPHTKLRTSDFKSVCKALNIDAKRIQRAIEVNPKFPTKAHLLQKLAQVCGEQHKSKKKRSSKK